MNQQWNYFLKNLGVWQGSFARFSFQGDLLEEIPSVLALEACEQQQVQLTLRRWLHDPQMGSLSHSGMPHVLRAPEEIVQSYRPPLSNVLFFSTGAFCRGSWQWLPSAEFWAEYSLFDGDRRLRLVLQLTQDGQPKPFTLIRERLAAVNGSDSLDSARLATLQSTAEQLPLQLQSLLGEWQGQAVTQYADGRPPTTVPTQLVLRCDGRRLVQQLTFGRGGSARTIASTARIEGGRLLFEQNPLLPQVLLLPGGASVNCPSQLKPGHTFVVELGWLLKPNCRQRLMRRYCDRGQWVSATLVNEWRVVSE